MNQKSYAVFVDLENAGAKQSTLQNIIEKVKIRGDILLGKVYGYTDRYTELKEVLLSNTFYVVPSLRYGKNQKNNLDIQLVIDAMEVAYVNPLIDGFCIVSGDSDYTPLVGKLKSMGKHVLGISRSEVASNIFIKACNEFIFLESVATAAPVQEKARDRDVGGREELKELAALIPTILEDQADERMYASELKGTILRLRPDFNEKNYGCGSFGKLMALIARESPRIRLETVDSSLIITLENGDTSTQSMDKTNWLPAFKQQLERFKQEGFERVNPSILKAAIQAEYPNFDEHKIGFKKFSDIMKRLEREKLLVIEMDEAKTMLLRII